MKTLNEVIERLAQEYYSDYMSGAGSITCYTKILPKLETAAFIYDKGISELAKMLEEKVFPNHALMMAEE